MFDDSRSRTGIDDQLRTNGEESALGPYLGAIRRRPLLFVAIVAVCVLAAGAWLQIRTPQYNATARLLVDAVPGDDPTYLGVLVLRQSGDPTRTMQTAAGVAEGSGAANLTAARLGPAWDERRVSMNVDVQPAGQSDILDVKGTADSATEASRLANAYAAAVLEIRRRQVERSVSGAIAAVRRALTRNPGEAGAAELNQRLSTLLTLREAGDSTFSVVEPAGRPLGPEGAPALLVIALSLLAGLALACGAIMLLQAVAPPRVETEEESLDTFPLPVTEGSPPAGAA